MMTSHRLFKGVVVVLAALLVALMGLAPVAGADDADQCAPPV